MVKKLFGLLFGAATVVTFAGSGAGCSSSDDGAPPLEDASTEARAKIDRNEGQTLACLGEAQEFVYLGPQSQTGFCTADQIEQFLNCFTNGDEGKCTAFLDLPANAHCVNDCLITAKGASKYGAVILPYINYVGYYEINGISKACLDAQWKQFSCEASSCGQCETDADTSACGDIIYDQTSGQCYQMGLAAITACQAESAKITTLDADLKNTDGVRRIMTAFCGAGSVGDAGSDSGSDAAGDGATDASSDADASGS